MDDSVYVLFLKGQKVNVFLFNYLKENQSNGSKKSRRSTFTLSVFISQSRLNHFNKKKIITEII